MNAIPDSLASPMTEEDSRLHALHALDLLDSEPETAFDALVALAGQRFDCPVAMLTLVDRDRQWVKAKVGTDIAETSRNVAFCDYTVRNDAPLLVEDAIADLRFVNNPLVTGEPHIRFYAGAPVHATDGSGRHTIGAVCLIDTRPRTMTAEQLEALTRIAAIAEALIASRAAASEAVSIAHDLQAQSRVLRRQDRVFRQVERLTRIGSWRLDLGTDVVTWSEGVYRIHELESADQPDLGRALDFYPPRDRALITEALTRTIETGAPYEIDLDFITAKGKRRRVRSHGELEIDQGRAIAVVGVFQDITDAYRVERKLRESASTDEVTRIANRAEFNRVLEAELQAARRGAEMVLILIDLDDFKTVNDTYGHLAGDDVLRAIGQRLRAPFLKDSFAARLGGDEFALLLTDTDLVATAPTVIAQLLDHLKMPVQSGDALLPVSGTIGSASPSPGLDNVRELMHAADVALYAAKRARRGTAHAFVERRAVGT